MTLLFLCRYGNLETLTGLGVHYLPLVLTEAPF